MGRSLVLLAILAVAVPVRAQTIIFSNLGPGDAYNINVGLTVSGPASFPGPRVWSANSFVAGQSGQLRTVEAAISLVGGTNSVDLFLAEDNNGIPDNVLESFHFAGMMGPFGTKAPLLKGTSTLHPALNMGTTYWLYATANGDTAAAWNLNVVDPSFGVDQQTEADNNGNWFAVAAPRGAFRVEAVPEGSGLALFTAGFLTIGMAAIGTRSKAARKTILS